jgi:DNA-binding transcriptional MerR regulator
MASIATPQSTEETNLFRIGEVSRLTDTKAFVLRYWETEFPMLQPVKSSSGHRLYRQEDVDMVLRIKRLLYDEGFTIAGARRHLRDEPLAVPGGEGSAPNGLLFDTTPKNGTTKKGRNSQRQLERKMLLDLRDSLRSFLTLLERK